MDVRVLAATHRDLETAIEEREFREDLYYRLSVVTIHLPPLSERAEDIPDLVQVLHSSLRQGIGVTSPFDPARGISFLQSQPGPATSGNWKMSSARRCCCAGPFAISLDHVRNALQKPELLVSATYQSINSYVGEVLRAAEHGEITDARDVIVRTIERELYAQAIKQACGNLTKAAKWLGVSRVTMREKLSAFGLRSEVSSQ